MKIRDERGQLGAIDLLGEQRHPRAKRGGLGLIDRTFRHQCGDARAKALAKCLERAVEHGDTRDLDLADQLELREDRHMALGHDGRKLELERIGVRHLVALAVGDGDHRRRRESELHARELDRLERDAGRLAGDDGARRRHIAVAEEELQLFLADLVEPLELAVKPRDLGERGVELPDEEVAREAVEATVRALADRWVVGKTRDEALEALVGERQIAAIGRRAEPRRGGRRKRSAASDDEEGEYDEKRSSHGESAGHGRKFDGVRRDGGRTGNAWTERQYGATVGLSRTRAPACAGTVSRLPWPC